MTDPISDMLSRIRNAHAVGKTEVVLPMSKVKFAIAQILVRENWITKAEIIKGGLDNNETKKSNFDQIKIILKYKKNGMPAIQNLKRISKPGLRKYSKKENLPVVLNSFGMAVVSTPQGLMTNKEARKKGVGGEVLFEIY